MTFYLIHIAVLELEFLSVEVLLCNKKSKHNTSPHCLFGVSQVSKTLSSPIYLEAATLAACF